MNTLQDYIKDAMSRRARRPNDSSVMATVRNAIARVNEYKNGLYVGNADKRNVSGVEVTILYDPDTREYFNDFDDTRNSNLINVIETLTKDREHSNFRGNGRSRRQRNLIVGTIKIKP